uniref:Ammonium transporter AmtB-like domain-containing protein n=1 Tax=Zosterops lateralis melanops TaxID=1220523 RepID=A0A8D2NT49_ZOSLA
MAVPPSTYPCRLLPLFLGLFQAALLLFFALFVTYDEPSAQAEDTSLVANQVYSTFPFFQDIQVMLVVGLGLLLTFLPRYGFSSLTHNFLLLNFSMQWALVLQGLLHHFHHGQIHLDLHKLLISEFAAVTVLISVGAILGRASPCQLLVMATCEIPIYLASEWVIVTCLGVLDVGGTITIHIFSCYFGLGVSKALFRATQQPLHPKESPTPSSDLMSLVGTLILWVFWPSFVAVLCQPGDAQHRAILNTLLAMSASSITTVVASSLLERDGKLSPGHLQNGSLAGGVAIGVVADMAMPPVAALSIGLSLSERHHPQCPPRPSAPDSSAHSGQHLEEAASPGHSYRKGTLYPLPAVWNCSSRETAPRQRSLQGSDNPSWAIHPPGQFAKESASCFLPLAQK